MIFQRRYVYPNLSAKYKIKCTFNLNSAWLGKSDTDWHLTREEIKEYNLKDCKVVKVKIEEVSYSVSPKLPCKNCVCSRGEYGFDI